MEQTTGKSGKKPEKSQRQQGNKKRNKQRGMNKKKTVRGQFFEPFLGLSFIFSANTSLGVAFFDFFFSAGGSSGASTGAARPCKITKGTSRGSEKRSTRSQYQEEGYTFFFTWVFFGVGTSEFEELELDSDTSSSNTRPLMSMGRCFIVYKNHKKY